MTGRLIFQANEDDYNNVISQYPHKTASYILVI